MTLYEKTVKGTLFGSANPVHDIPQAARALPGGQAQARRADHQALHARRDQPGLPGHARRQEHPRRDRPRALSRPDAPLARPRVDERDRRPAPRGARCSPARWPAAATSCSRGRRAPASRRCCAPSPTAAGLGVEFVEGNAELTPARLVGHHDPALVLEAGYRADTFVDGPLLTALREGRLLYIEELNRVPGGDAQRARRRAGRGRDPRAAARPRRRPADGFRLIAAMNPFDAVGTARVSQAISDRMCRIAIGYQDDARRAARSSSA